MREHAIPQDVVGYRFHIIGNMTLKQFLEVGAGCVVGFIFYTTNLPDILKWPLIGLAVATGTMAAFVPFEERPLDHWITTFVLVLYKPTKFFWRKEPKIPDAFLFKTHQTKPNVTELDLSPARRQRIREYLGSLDTDQVDPTDLAERQRVSEILNSFMTTPVQLVSSTKTYQRPQLKVSTHSLKGLDAEAETLTVAVSDTGEDSVYVYAPTEPARPISTPDIYKQQLDPSQVAQQIEIPELETLTLNSQQTVAADEIAQTNPADQDQFAYSTVTSQTQQIDTSQSQQVTHNVNLPFPVPPVEPNKLVGMVLTPHNEILNDTVVEIITPDNNVARAVKTNALGQFYITTPLANGEYTLLAEKDGFNFLPVQLSLTGTIVDPLEIRSVV